MIPLLILLAIGTVAHADDRSVAIVVVGNDPVAAGAMQHALETAVSRRRPTIARDMLAERFGLPKPTPTAVPEPEPSIEAAKEAFYKARFDVALKALDEAERQLAGADTSLREVRVRVQLWRAAILLSTERIVEARASVDAALRIDPHLEVDLAVFWPSVATLVEQVREGRSTVKVEVVDIPVGARVRVDGLPVERAFVVTPGTHRISVDAPGYRPLDLGTEILSETRLSLPLALAMPVTTNDALIAIARGNGDTTRFPVVDELATRFGATDVVVAALFDGQARVVMSSGARSPTFAMTDRGRVVEWTLAELTRKTTTTARPNSRNLVVGLSIAPTIYNREVANETARAAHEGLGIQVEVETEYGRHWSKRWRWVATATIAVTALRSGEVTASGIPAPSDSSIRMGSTFSAGALWGVQRLISSGRFAVSLALGARFGSIESADIDNRHLFDPVTHLALQGRFAIAAQLGRRGFGSLHGTVLGSNSLAGTVAELEVGWRLQPHWSLAARAKYERLQIFNTATPELSDATRQETSTTIGAQLARAF